MKYTIRFTLATLAVAAAVVSTGAPAHADYDFAKVADPHIPAPEMGWCLGGSGAGALFVSPFCDGEHYPDGSFWRFTKDYFTYARHWDCVMDNGGSPNPPLAPPGGCGGAVK